MATYPATGNGYPLPEDTTKIKDFPDVVRQLSTKADANFIQSMNFVSAVNESVAPGDAATLASAKSYADSKKTEAITAAGTAADSKDVTTLNSAKSYADTKKTEALAAAATDATNKSKNSAIAAYVTPFRDEGDGAGVVPSPTYWAIDNMFYRHALGLKAGIVPTATKTTGVPRNISDPVNGGVIVPYAITGVTQNLVQQSTDTSDSSPFLYGTGQVGIKSHGVYSMNFTAGVAYGVAMANTDLVLIVNHTRGAVNTTVAYSEFPCVMAGGGKQVQINVPFMHLKRDDYLTVRVWFAGTGGTVANLSPALTYMSIALVAPGTATL